MSLALTNADLYKLYFVDELMLLMQLLCTLKLPLSDLLATMQIEATT